MRWPRAPRPPSPANPRKSLRVIAPDVWVEGPVRPLDDRHDITPDRPAVELESLVARIPGARSGEHADLVARRRHLDARRADPLQHGTVEIARRRDLVVDGDP